jgi:hypothetical protein
MSGEDKLSLGYYLALGQKYKICQGSKLLEWAENKLAEAEEKHREETKLKIELAEREAKRDLEKLRIESEEMVKLKTLELEQQSLCNQRVVEQTKSYVPRLKLIGLKSNGGPMDMEVVIDIFEREAREVGLDHRYWCHEFRKVLLDRGCDAWLTELGAEEDYTKLKREVLKHFGLTESGYSNRFNSSKPNSEDKPGSYIRRTRHYLKRWVELSGIEKTYDGLFDLILKDKILRTVSEDIRQHILIHNPRTVDEVEKQCDNYFAIFPTKQLGDSPDAPTELIATIAESMQSVLKDDRRLSRSNSPHFRHSYRHNTHSSKSPQYRHHPRDNSGPRRSQFTKHRQNSDSDSDSYVQSPGPSRQTTRTYNNSPRPQTKCFSCGLRGHIAADCNVDTERTQRQGRNKSPKVDKSRNKQKKVSFRNKER